MRDDQILFTSGDTQRLKIGPYQFKDARLVLPDASITTIPESEQIADFHKRLASIDPLTRSYVREISREVADQFVESIRRPSAVQGMAGSNIGPVAENPSQFTRPAPSFPFGPAGDTTPKE